MAHKNEDGVQNDICDTADQQTGHTYLGPSIRPDDTAECAVNHGKGEAQHNDAPVFQRIGQIPLCSPEQMAERLQKQFKENQQKHTDTNCQGVGDLSGKFCKVPPVPGDSKYLVNVSLGRLEHLGPIGPHIWP